MLRQTSFSDLDYANKKRRTRRELFLAEMDAVVPWPELLAVVEPHYPRTGGRGRPPVGLASMLRIYFLQQWFALSDRQTEDGLYDRRACVVLPVFPMSRRLFPTRPRSSTFAICWSDTI
jgi:transposase, IS5 family